MSIYDIVGRYGCRAGVSAGGDAPARAAPCGGGRGARGLAHRRARPARLPREPRDDVPAAGTVGGRRPSQVAPGGRRRAATAPLPGDSPGQKGARRLPEGTAGARRRGPGSPVSPGDPRRVSLATIAIEWGRIGVTGFGGPPAHIGLLRRLCVERRGWLSAREFEDGIAAPGFRPGPASTQLAIYCAWRLRGPAGALVGALCFIGPGLLVILGLSALFLEARPPLPVVGAAAGAGAAVPAVALHSALGLLPASRRRAGESGRWRWGLYLAAGAAAAAAGGPWVRARIWACGVPPGPVVLTVAVVGYAAAGAGGAGLASVVAFAPSFGFVLLGAPHFAALRSSSSVQGFLAGAGPAAVGGIAGAAIPLGLALGHLWQAAVLALAAGWLLGARRGVVSALGGAAGLGVLAALAGMAISR